MERSANTLLLTLFATLAAACAGSRATSTYQADHVLPRYQELEDEPEQVALKDAQSHLDRGDLARDSDNSDQARAEWRDGAVGLARLVERYPSSRWRLVYLRAAAESFARAQEYAGAAEAAEKILLDPAAAPASRVDAARLDAAAWQAIALAEVKAGNLEPIRLLTQEKRKGEKLAPRPPPGAWKRFVDAADTYLTLAGSGPKPAKPDEAAASARFSARLALMAAEVEYAFDDVEEARVRFERILAAWPSDAEVMDAVVPFHLQTFLLAGDGDAAYLAALDRSAALVDAELRKAQSAAQAPDASEQDRVAAATFAGLAERLARARQGTTFFAAKKLLDEGKAAEAAAAFEQLAAQGRADGEAPQALYNASVAWEKAGAPAKADADRRRVIADFPDSRAASQATLALASALSRRSRDHAAAETLYAQYLTRWPDGEQRCLALLNVGYEADQQRKRLDAAVRYQAFGTDAACAKGDPSGAARALHRSGVLFLQVKQGPRAMQTWKALAELSGPLDPTATSQVEDARRRWKKREIR
jgi:hypothetical protein